MTNEPFTPDAVQQLERGLTELTTDDLSETNRGKCELLMNLYNTQQAKVSDLVSAYFKAVSNVREVNKIQEDMVDAKKQVLLLESNLITELTNYKKTKLALQTKIKELKISLEEAKANAGRKDKKEIAQLKSQLDVLNKRLEEISAMSKKIKKSSKENFGVVPIYTLNNALYHEKNMGGVLGILKQVYAFLTSGEYKKSTVKAFLNMLSKDFDYESKKITSISNFDDSKMEVPEDINIDIAKIKTNLTALLAELKQKTSAFEGSKQDIATINNKIKTFIESDYCSNVPEVVNNVVKSYCSLAYMNAVYPEVLASIV